ncbi:uncharacterized protein LOC123690323 [Pieris rapae]|uniref:uncharacterized protein LOC123690323 n=1 Tax=Pieris rapae TaxID=64459 RepID=UPI001E27D11D|nr:uncharacterized protein LOC123690323 [Pieris rapae]XP_045489548.1 uncharacterized protein LOC123690323 [Pieris rapae]
MYIQFVLYDKTYFPQIEMNQNNSGNPRGRSHNSGGNRRDMSFQPEEFDPARVQNRERKPTERSTAFKGKKKPKQPQRPQEPEQTVVPSTTSTPYRDEPMYDVGPHSSLLAAQDVYCQNFEFSGFIPLINETYEKMRGIDPRLHERLPLSMFTHAMAVHLNLEILETARLAGQNVLNLRTDAREVLPDYQVLPQSIVDYISHVAPVITQDGKEIRLNLPPTAIPLGPVVVDGIAQPSGSFGPIAANNHNTYECYISPLVTSRRVIASTNNMADYLPLPDALIPGNLVPNSNLLGFEPIDIQNAGATARLQGTTRGTIVRPAGDEAW